MKIILLLFLISISFVYSQEIETGTSFTIEFYNPEKPEYRIINKNKYHLIINDQVTDTVFADNIPAKNQIKGIFAKGKFGDNNGSMLVLISGLDETVQYDLKIKSPVNNTLRKTSVSPLYKNIRSIEYWPYDIEKINISNLRIYTEENPEFIPFEVKTDSTCIKNPAINIESGEREFIHHIKSVILNIEGNKLFKVDQQIQYEKSINANNISLGYYWSLGEGIYPNKKRFKFADPLSYRRTECPYFEGSVHYFYTKAKNDIKVVSFEWETFKDSDFGTNPEIEGNIDNKFIAKYNFLVKEISNIMGAPLNIPQQMDSGRIDTKWHSKNGINAYLFRFTHYNNIRLYIYKE